VGCRHHQDTQAVRQSLTAHGYLGACRAILARDIGCIAERPAAGLDASRALLDAHEAELPALQRIRYVAAGWMTNVARFSRSHNDYAGPTWRLGTEVLCLGCSSTAAAQQRSAAAATAPSTSTPPTAPSAASDSPGSFLTYE